MTIAASFLIHESAEVYQAKASEHLTSHQLADFRRCPLLYRKKKLGVVEDEDRPAFLVGRALHTLVLEGLQRFSTCYQTGSDRQLAATGSQAKNALQEAFDEQYAVGGPVNPKTGQPYGSNTKAFAQWAAAQGKPVLTVGQCDLVQRMAEGVRGHGLARDLLSEGTPEGVVRAEQTSPILNVQRERQSVCDAPRFTWTHLRLGRAIGAGVVAVTALQHVVSAVFVSSRGCHSSRASA